MPRVSEAQKRAERLSRLFKKWDANMPGFNCGTCCKGPAALEVILVLDGFDPGSPDFPNPRKSSSYESGTMEPYRGRYNSAMLTSRERRLLADSLEALEWGALREVHDERLLEMLQFCLALLQLQKFHLMLRSLEDLNRSK